MTARAAARPDARDNRQLRTTSSAKLCLGAAPLLLATDSASPRLAASCVGRPTLALSGRTVATNPCSCPAQRIQARVRTTRAQCRVAGHRRQTPRRPKAAGGAVTTADVAVFRRDVSRHAQRITTTGREAKSSRRLSCWLVDRGADHRRHGRTPQRRAQTRARATKVSSCLILIS